MKGRLVLHHKCRMVRALISILYVSAAAVYLASPLSAKPNYQFNGKISQEVLNNYLSRAITVTELSTTKTLNDDIRMIKNVGAKFVGRAAFLWGQPPADEEQYWRQAKALAYRLHTADPDIVAQACVFEAIYDGIDRIPIPGWVFAEYRMKPEKRCFRYRDMRLEGAPGNHDWGPNSAIPDISKLETQMWFYYRSRRYIDAGYEAIHFGQMFLIGWHDKDYRCWADVLSRIRRHASKRARRHMVICDAHVSLSGSLPIINGRLLLDFFSFPQRPKEIIDQPQKAILEMDYGDSIYGRTPGGVTPSGWKCERVPYLVETDNCGVSERPGQSGRGAPWVWGYDEASWFARQSEEYRNYWLQYSYDWLRKNDANGHLQMPGSVPICVPVGGTYWYKANSRSQSCPNGFNQEATIKAIWSKQEVH